MGKVAYCYSYQRCIPGPNHSKRPLQVQSPQLRSCPISVDPEYMVHPTSCPRLCGSGFGKLLLQVANVITHVRSLSVSRRCIPYVFLVCFAQGVKCAPRQTESQPRALRSPRFLEASGCVYHTTFTLGLACFVGAS